MAAGIKADIWNWPRLNFKGFSSDNAVHGTGTPWSEMIVWSLVSRVLPSPLKSLDGFAIAHTNALSGLHDSSTVMTKINPVVL